MAVTSEQFSNHALIVDSADARAPASAVSWGAILAGAAAAAALSLILLILGTGLGLSSVSPWTQNGVGAKAFGISTILWVCITQLLASGMGGYLAGRLRTRWIAVHADEVHFRDSAHGFLAWCVASLVTAALLTTVIGSIVSGGIQAASAAAGGATATAAAAIAGSGAAQGTGSDRSAEPMAYFVDTLFRKDANTPLASENAAGNSPMGGNDTTSNLSGAEVTRIFAFGMHDEVLPPADLRYVGQLVAERTGLTQADAEKRVNDTYLRMQALLHGAETKAREAADQARKASAYTAMWLFISLLIGAFIASLTAIYGGRQRDL